MEFTLTGPRTRACAAWHSVADTDWMNRVAGNGVVVDMKMGVDDQNRPQMSGVLSGAQGNLLPFVETECSWVHGRYFIQGRAFASGPVSYSRYTVQLHPDGDGVVPEIKMEITPRTGLLPPVVGASLRRMENRWRSLLEGLPNVDEAPVRIARRELSRNVTSTIQALDGKVDGHILGHIREHLAGARPLELQRMRVFQLADQWDVSRDELLEGFLHGVHGGLLELYWSVRCPRCFAQTDATTTLGDLANHANCPSCQLDFQTDLGTHVEVLFAPHPSVTPRIEERFCTLFPMAVPEIVGCWILPGGAEQTEDVPMETGEWRLGSGAGKDVTLVPHADGDPSLSWAPDSKGTERVSMGSVALSLKNPYDHPMRVQLIRIRSGKDVLMAGQLTTVPSFRRSMGHQVLAVGTRISTRSVCLLFTDLTDSTAMYEEMGDAAAYALVRDHFTVLEKVVEANRGVMVKTIGDAVMAAFYHPASAMQASLDMLKDFDQAMADRGLENPPKLKIGFHQGPALVVHSNAHGVDYFGGTVNTAARTQGLAKGGEVLFSVPCMSDHGLRKILQQAGLKAERLDATLKGLSKPVGLHRVRPD
ncbi:MAG: hypothetical protein GWP91_07955 [Rhodobacterales bacterium]|nr:hypothetical protein [Rhodobacterales bacterium]